MSQSRSSQRPLTKPDDDAYETMHTVPRVVFPTRVGL
eukprot:COSAG06_NODE_419_length_15981_cov_12.672019_3_plen_37_part_00